MFFRLAHFGVDKGNAASVRRPLKQATPKSVLDVRSKRVVAVRASYRQHHAQFLLVTNKFTRKVY